MPADPAAAQLAAAAFQSLPSVAAVIDSDGEVLLVNDAWSDFGRANGAGPGAGVGSNYLQVCHAAAEAGDPIAAVVEAALNALLMDHAPRIALEYPCHGPTVQRWFHLRAQHVAARRQVIVVHDEISSHVVEKARLRHATTHDRLTGLPNRELLHDRLSAAVGGGTRQQDTAVAVLLVDLDDFERVNDEHGELAGDVVLAAVARRLQEVGRAWDTVARWSDDEFVLVLPGCTAEAAERVRQRVADVVSRTVDVGVSSVTVTASTGVAVGARGDGIDQLIAVAEQSLKAAKADRAEGR